MWVFGYGSLMWDNWEKDFAGVKFDHATLHDFHRSFNKSSVVNWGTNENPGPTLGLEPKAGEICIGTAFEIPKEQEAAVMAELARREGRSFALKPLEIVLADGRKVQALVPVNDRTRPTYLGGKALDELVALAKAAGGTSGSCVSYIENIGRELRSLGIEDRYVESFVSKLCRDA
ncbi:MAG: gamma-glutamylcyclotransferase [Pseudomonadota bacterium]|nr:gamma-glutamylcyclotransferase [Pseudomonadota bacterium]